MRPRAPSPRLCSTPRGPRCYCLCSCWLAASDGDPCSRPGYPTEVHSKKKKKPTRARKKKTQLQLMLKILTVESQAASSHLFRTIYINFRRGVVGARQDEGGRDDRGQAILPLPFQEFPCKRANRKAILYTRIRWSKELGESNTGVSVGRPDGVK